MKRIVILGIVAVLGAAPVASLAATYTPSQAAAHIGETATVEDVVSQTHVDDKSGAGFLNMGGRFPNHDFQGFISQRDIGKFGNLHRYEGKTVGITGKIRDFNGKPEIIVSDPGQIQAR
jgi:DNA/RNA endonuclease YhcR with UshA esterase domain